MPHSPPVPPASDTKPLHIVMVLPTYLPESFGGAEQQARKLSVGLVRRRHRVTLLAPRLHAATPARETVDGVDIIRFKLGAPPNFGGKYFASFLAWSVHLIRWLSANKNNIDVVHIFHGRLHAVPAVIGAHWAHKPSLIKIGRGGDLFDFKTLHSKKVYGPTFARQVKRWATGYIANSAEIIDDLKSAGIAENIIHAIPNGVELPPLDPPDPLDPPAPDPTHTGPVRFVFLGRLDAEKKVDSLIRAIAAADRACNVHLDLIGDGDLRPALETLVAKLGAAGRVTFHGRTDDVAPYLRAADFFISASESEGMSNALMEAMSFAVPPLVTNVSGVEDLVTNGDNGLLFPAGDVQSITRIIERAARLPHEDRLAMAAAARATVENTFSMETVIAQHEALYRNVMRRT